MRAETGKRIRRWREERKLSQLDAARGARLSQSEWQKLETGRSRRVSLETARRLVAYTGGAISFDDLADKRKLPMALDPIESEPGPSVTAKTG